MFSLQLSVSTQKASDKNSALKITQFQVQDVSVDLSSLKEIFTNYNYSTNQWVGGKCKNVNFARMSGITLDIDQGYTIEEAKETFKDFNYILHTSTSHKEDKPSKGGIQDRYRIILPFDPHEYGTFNSPELAEGVYNVLMAKYKFVDGSCKDPGRKYFPFLNKAYPHLYECFINDTGKYFTVLMEDVQNMMTSSAPISKIAGDLYVLSLETEVVLLDKKTKMKIKDINAKTSCYCVFCDDLNSSNGSAVVYTPPDGRKYMWCSHCNKTYWLSLPESYPELFYVGSRMMRVVTSNGNIGIDDMPTAYLNHLPPNVRKNFEHELSKTRGFAGDMFFINRLADGYSEKVHWSLDVSKASLDIHIPPIPENVKDNAYIERWLDETFGKYNDFIKDWVAIWCYENFQPLPVLVFNGPRSSGKSTFGEFLQNIYKSLTAEWKGDVSTFTDFKEKKLILMEEVETDTRVQYEEVKRLSGTSDVTINKKFAVPYRVRNNVSIVLLTNSFRPMYLNTNERPKGEYENQFFYMSFAPRTKINAHIKYELADRAGHYVRTELRDRYERWKSSPVSRNNRYGIPCPMTDLLIQQFDDAKTTVELDAEELYNAMRAGVKVTRNGIATKTLGPYNEITYRELSELLRVLKLPTKNPKTVRERLQSMGYLSVGEMITKKGKAAYRVLTPTVPRDYEQMEAEQ